MRTFVIGDIHGNSGALDKLLTRAGFDFAVDRLIVVGDVADGGRDTRGCVSTLLKVRDLIFVIGNHDVWTRNWMREWSRAEADWPDIFAPRIWTSQGGYATMESYEFGATIEKSHVEFFESGIFWYLDDANNLFVHGGFVPNVPLEDQDPEEILIWDRDLIDYAAVRGGVPGYRRVYIGHTSTMLRFGVSKPVTLGNLICVDTGVYLSLIEIDSECGPIGLWQEKKGEYDNFQYVEDC